MRHAKSVRLVEGSPAVDVAPGSRRGQAADVGAVVEIWTDGACKGNPGVGGWGAWLKSGTHERELFGGELETTNNRMELTAVIEALAALKRRSRVTLHTDSQYVQLGISQWMPAWLRRGWKTADNKPVKNVDLWQRLYTLSQQHQVDWRWVRGHAGDIGNERADELANRGVAMARMTGKKA